MLKYLYSTPCLKVLWSLKKCVGVENMHSCQNGTLRKVDKVWKKSKSSSMIIFKLMFTIKLDLVRLWWSTPYETELWKMLLEQIVHQEEILACFESPTTFCTLCLPVFWVKPSFGWSFAFEQKFWVEQNQAKQLAAFSPRLACLLEVAGKSCKEGTKPSGTLAFHNCGLPAHQPYIQFCFGFIIFDQYWTYFCHVGFSWSTIRAPLEMTEISSYKSLGSSQHKC